MFKSNPNGNFHIKYNKQTSDKDITILYQMLPQIIKTLQVSAYIGDKKNEKNSNYVYEILTVLM